MTVKSVDMAAAVHHGDNRQTASPSPERWMTRRISRESRPATGSRSRHAGGGDGCSKTRNDLTRLTVHLRTGRGGCASSAPSQGELLPLHPIIRPRTGEQRT